MRIHASEHTRVTRGRRSWRVLPLVIASIVLGLALPFVAPALAWAHAYPVKASVMPNAVLKTTPTSISITFAEDVNPNGSDIVIYDAKGQPVSTNAQVDRNDLKTMTVQMHGDGSQTYLVEWHTVSADDGDADIGAYTFLVDPSAETKTDSGDSFGATNATAAKPSGGVPVWALVGVGIAGLVIGAGAMAAARRR